MKKITIYLLTIILVQIGFAQNPDSLFSQYQTLKQQGKNKQAFETLHHLVNYWLDIDPLMASQYAAMEKQEAQQSGDSLMIARSLNDIGLSYLAQKTYFMATEAFFKAYDIYLKHNDKKGLAYTLLNIGKAYLQQGIADIAESKFKAAKNIFDQINDKHGQALALQYLGLANLKTDEQVAVNYFQQAINILNQLKDYQTLAETKFLLAQAYYEIGENDSSIAYTKQALQFFKQNNNKIWIARNYKLLALNYYDKDDIHRSYANALKALRIFSRLNNNENIADTYLIFAKIFHKKGQLDSSISNALKSAHIAETFGYNQILSQDYELLAQAYAQKKNYALAYHYQSLYARTLSQLFEDVKQQHFSSFQMNLETENKEKQIQLLKIQSEKERLQKDKELYRRTVVYTLIIIALIIIFGFLLILRYREKVKTSQLLEATNDQLMEEIEHRKNTEEQLKNSEEKYRLLFRKTPVGIFQYNENLIITDANDRFAEILHIHRNEIINQPLDKFFDRNMIRNLKECLENEKEIIDQQIEILTRQGLVYVKISVKPYKYIHDNKPLKSAIVIVQDITEHKKNEQLYKNNISRKQQLIELLPDSLILVNAGGQILDAHLPHSPELEIGAKHIKDIVSEKTAGLFINELDLAIKNNRTRKFIFTNSKGNRLLTRIIPTKTGNALIIITLIPSFLFSEHPEPAKTNISFVTNHSKNAVLKNLENEIETELIPTYQNLQRALSFVMIKNFIERIESIAKHYNLADLKEYAEKLQSALEEFDVSKVTDLLSQFPALINKYIGYETISF